MTDSNSSASDQTGEKPTSPVLQLYETAELVESCRAHASSMAELADATSKGLSGGYCYEHNEPYLHECCGLVQRVLEKAESVLSELGVVSMEGPRPDICTGCLEQEQWLKGAAHTVRAVISLLSSVEPNDHPQVLQALGDLDGGIWTLVDGLKAIAERESRA